ncbi:sugar ABC transporter ATP-binding protein [Conexibacter stalactiti]|uniref:Sugar ABC transporter ATP-binding protein n=1 Tax=Conexibacter stalactiti TaxID=1940611 RepID=A0ABU4HR80_9ACTN|nr:sugar ABC transporter ATP-binding protein [Conexibacter stalactiti]MDW5595796.1 sugar ABC transporter ATP-binding protein [Conexibacter stalactiti]MEC5036438.1 sugar ABC transporter ATP-binding protein [Conexibacter stalactiti]
MAGRLTSSPGAGTSSEVPALALHGLSKRFGAQAALSGVDLELRAGEVHALLGQNGSGKSTLIKLLAGFHEPDGEPRAELLGAPLRLGSAAAAHAAGIRFVHQDLALVPGLAIVDNLALGERYAGRLWLGDRRELAAARALLESLGIELDPARPLRELAPAQRTIVAVARALSAGVGATRLLVLDEVTATLPESEVELVFALVRRIREQGGTVLYVTHRLEEVFALADRVTVLRDGRRVSTSAVAGLDHDGLVELIVGRPLEQLYPKPPAPRAELALQARGLSGRVARAVDLDLHRGEIVGVAGLAGSGRDELPYLLFGAAPWSAGRLTVDGREHRALTPHAAIAAGLALIPADRAGAGATPSLSLRTNVTLPRIRAGRLRWIGRRAERADVAGWLRRLQVTPPDGEAPLATLSGGNQQKVVLARWFRLAPTALLLDEPTQGVDVGSKAAIYDQLATSARERQLAVLVASTDHEELAAICDRVLVMRGGRIAAQLSGAALSADAISQQILTAPPPRHGMT